MFHDAHPDRLAHLEAASGSGILNVFGLSIYLRVTHYSPEKFRFMQHSHTRIHLCAYVTQRSPTAATEKTRHLNHEAPGPPQGTDPRLRRSFSLRQPLHGQRPGSSVIFADRKRSRTCTLLVQKSSLPIGFLIESHVSYAASQVSVPLLFFV